MESGPPGAGKVFREVSEADSSGGILSRAVPRWTPTGRIFGCRTGSGDRVAARRRGRSSFSAVANFLESSFPMQEGHRMTGVPEPIRTLRLALVRQSFNHHPVEIDPATAVERELTRIGPDLARAVPPGGRIALALGSRGVGGCRGSWRRWWRACGRGATSPSRSRRWGATGGRLRRAGEDSRAPGDHGGEHRSAHPVAGTDAPGGKDRFGAAGLCRPPGGGGGTRWCR